MEAKYQNLCFGFRIFQLCLTVEPKSFEEINDGKIAEPNDEVAQEHL
jgi:hypothetical protein